MLTGPFYLLQLSTTVGSQRKRVEQRKKAFVFALGRPDAACTAVEKLSLACRWCATFRMNRIKVRTEGLSLVFRIFRQSAGTTV